jgi:hypothetical protein
MLALGSLDRFLTQEGTPALSASNSRTTTIASGADLPFGFTSTISYALTTSDRYQQVGDRQILTFTRQREWPAGNVHWTRSFHGGPFTLLTVGLAFRYREGSSSQPRLNELGALNAIKSSSLNPDIQISLKNGMSLSLGYSSLGQRSHNSGSTTLLDQDDITASFSYAFRLPSWVARSRKQLRSSITALSSKTQTCLEPDAGSDCTIISDVRRREFRGSLDTDVARALSAGLQVGYSLNDARHLNRRTSQIFLLASFQLSLDTGGY